MTIQRALTLALALSLLVVLLIGCGSPAPQPSGPGQGNEQNEAAITLVPGATPEKNNVEVAPGEAQIFLQEPEDGSGVDSPFYLRVGVANFKLPLDYVTIHIAIDAQCTPAGTTIPQDEQHVSLPVGTFENPRFALPLGQHRLCIQAANQDNVALKGPGMTRVIDVNVESVLEQNYD